MIKLKIAVAIENFVRFRVVFLSFFLLSALAFGGEWFITYCKVRYVARRDDVMRMRMMTKITMRLEAVSRASRVSRGLASG